MTRCVESLRGVVAECSWSVAPPVENTPEVDPALVLHVDGEVWVPRKWPRSECGDVEFMGEAEGAVVGVAPDVSETPSEGVGEPGGESRFGLGQVVSKGGVYVVGGEPA
jgi:hypothetical protein